MESIEKVASDAISNVTSEEVTEFDELSSDELSSEIEANPVKQPKTYDEQVALIKSKGFIVEDEKGCADFLRRANYYRLSAYFLPFRKSDGTYFQGVDFRRIQRIYELDGKIRNVLFRCIEEIEFYLRTQLAYFSGHNHGALGYLEENTFYDS